MSGLVVGGVRTVPKFTEVLPAVDHGHCLYAFDRDKILGRANSAVDRRYGKAHRVWKMERSLLEGMGHSLG